MRGYAQLTEAQRYQIYVLMRSGHRQSEIAALVGCYKSTISRELRRKRERHGYRPGQAQRFALTQCAAKSALSRRSERGSGACLPSTGTPSR